MINIELTIKKENLYKLEVKANCSYSVGWLVGWLVLVSRSGLVEEDAVEVFHYYSFHLSSSFLMHNFKSFQGKY